MRRLRAAGRDEPDDKQECDHDDNGENGGLSLHTPGDCIRRTAPATGAIIPVMMKKSIAAALAVLVLAPALTAQQKYRAPRTAWGDPDFSGNYTNLYEAGTPMERPAQFDGRKLGDVTPAELKQFKLNIQETTIQRFETPFDAPSNWWQDAFRLGASAQAWLIT